MEIIERVARALAYHNYDTEDVWESHVADARAALEAMREPTQAMIEAGESCPIVNYDGNDPKEVWQTMLDAALTSSEPKANGSPDSLPSNME